MARLCTFFGFFGSCATSQLNVTSLYRFGSCHSPFEYMASLPDLNRLYSSSALLPPICESVGMKPLSTNPLKNLSASMLPGSVSVQAPRPVVATGSTPVEAIQFAQPD